MSRYLKRYIAVVYGSMMAISLVMTFNPWYLVPIGGAAAYWWYVGPSRDSGSGQPHGPA